MTELYGDEYNAVFFDLDGTLVDTAPDMVAVLQALQRDHGIDPVTYELGRANVSNGAVGLLSVGFPKIVVEFGDDLHQEYLERYADAVCVESRLFPGLAQLLDDLDDAGCPWGIVTNKPEQLTMPLLMALDIAERSACIVCGDTLSVRKPDPAPLILACDLVDVVLPTGAALRRIIIGDPQGYSQAENALKFLTVLTSVGQVVVGIGDLFTDLWQVSGHDLIRVVLVKCRVDLNLGFGLAHTCQTVACGIDLAAKVAGITGIEAQATAVQELPAQLGLTHSERRQFVIVGSAK